MFKVKTMNAISQCGLDYLEKRGYEVGPEIDNPDAMLIRSADVHEMPFNEGLLAIARAGSGYNNIPIEKCAENGIAVFNSPGANAIGVREQVMMSFVLASRNVLGAMEFVKSIADKGAEIPTLVEKGKNDFAGPELLGKSLGVIGLGATGALVANIAVEYGMKVYGFDPYMSIDAAWLLNRDVIRAEVVEEIYANCDYISLNVPFNDSTRCMINEDALNKMRDGVRIVNESRAEVVDDVAMTEALKSGKVGKYITDFPNEVILKAPNVIALPHLGACTPESEERCAIMSAAEIVDYLENGNIKHSVNLPDASLIRMGVCRVCVIHRNVPRMLTKILDFISNRNINVEHMINKAKGEYAYTIIDLGKKIGPKTISEMEKIENIIRVRVLYVD